MNHFRTHAFVAFVFLTLTMSASGCLHARAKVAEASPPLTVPFPPPRIVETTDGEVAQPVGLIEQPARNTPAPPAPVSTTPRAAEAPKVNEPPKPPEPPKVDNPPAPATEGPKLQTTSTQQEVELENRIRADMSSANANLSRIYYQGLSAGARTQYDTARSYVRQAEQELRARNFVFAQSLASKAATIAAQLSNR